LPSSEPTRGEIWQVDFDPTKGSEIKKRRPAIIVSSDALGVLPVRLVVPLTEWNDAYAGKIWIVRIDSSSRNGLRKDSAAETLQTRSVSLERLSNKVGILEERLLEQVVSALAILTEAV
jgi:mRNA interferase MazF